MYKNFDRFLSEKTSYDQLNRSNDQSSARSLPRQITYSTAAHFVDDEWEYDSINDTYHAAVQSFHFLDHISRNQDNTHDEDDAYANWANASSDYRCTHNDCTYYHD
jgi:hypothetical protein